MSISLEQLDVSKGDMEAAYTAWLDTLTASLDKFKSAYGPVAKAGIAYSEMLMEASQGAPQEVGEDYVHSAQHVASNLAFMLNSLMRYRRDKGLPANIFRVDR